MRRTQEQNPYEAPADARTTDVTSNKEPKWGRYLLAALSIVFCILYINLTIDEIRLIPRAFAGEITFKP